MSTTPVTTTPSDAGPAQQPAPTQQLNRSCESCRSLKVRCLPDHVFPNQCQRCVKAKRSCVFVAPQRRRPRKRTDSRVAQLEREMRQMRSLLKDRIRIDESSTESTGSEREDSFEPEFGSESREALQTIPDAPSSTSGSIRPIDASPGFASVSYPHTFEDGSIPATSFNPAQARYSPEVAIGDDVVDRGVISLDYANKLVAFYMTDLTMFSPMVTLPCDTTAAQLRRSKPVLFLSVIAAAAIAVDEGLAAVLNREMVRLYAERFFMNGDKSLELVQALLLMIVFYYPPDSPSKLQHYQYTHIAATMALEIGLASKRRVLNATDRKSSRQDGYDQHMAEQARAILGCYHLASTVAMKTRRPNLLLFNDWMEECVKHLENSPNLLDKHMATWFELQRIIDEAMASFGLDDTSSTTPLTESRIQAILRWFDSRMQSWMKNVPTELFTVPMAFEYHYTILAIYELAVGEGYRDPDAIKRQYYTLPRPEDDGSERHQTPPSAVRVDVTIKWMNAAQETLDTFLKCETDVMRAIPNLVYTRVGVAMMSLLKIYFSVRSGGLGEFITTQSINVEKYLDAMTNSLSEASGGGKYRIPSRWLYVIAIKARNWYDKFQQRQMQRETGLAPPTQTSPSTSQAPASFAHPPSYDPASTLPQPTGAYGMSVDVPQVSAYPTVGGGYGTPGGMTPAWPPDQGTNHLNFSGVTQFSVYTPPIVSSQYAYEASQPRVVQGGALHNGTPMAPNTGMELDGWVPDGGILGMPSLPEI
ncbi:C6 zinc finger domain protein [Aspergillus steynii IBT 23096]|uniref:C6 zinc finger domain protein n=1 Tax=Aspergillus steynii IBT 23096 TaxID=1392250 RepID=A0A2I2GQM2_9EURO|nr:C6 zinc finger domain protein [Aspergillus steynii IBT 23096]PLB55170.1 C6 zinc finger domain protein [Aspergillus steynii IBT 23096]